MIIRFFTLLICFGIIASATAQIKDLEKAHKHYEGALYKEAIPIYELALDQDPYLPEVILRLAESYRLTNDPTKAEVWYARLIRYEKHKAYMFEYADMLKTNMKYDEARKWFLEYARFARKDSVRGNHFARSCVYAKANIDRKNNAFSVRKMKGVNSKSSDFAPIMHQNELIFASARSVPIEKDGETTWTNDAFNQHYVYYPGARDSLSLVRPLRNFIGKDINDAPATYSKNSERVAITSNNFMDGIRHIAGSGLMMDLYLYDIKSIREWKHDTEEFFAYNAPSNAEKPFSTGHPSFSPKGDALYFSSNRPGGMGGYDIYVCYKTLRGWTKPKNLGFPVNTAGNEMTPSLDAYGRLYFSSDWHHGFGGMDIFTAEHLPFGWANVVNLGTAINTPYDDMYFTLDVQQRKGFFSSNRPGGIGNEDIYEVRQDNSLAKRQQKDIKIGEKLILGEIYYNSGQAGLQNTDTREMYNLLLTLADNPKTVLQINSFTDSRGSQTNNLRLSQKRAKAVAEYLVSKGINARRISYEGYGEQFLRNGCTDGKNCSEAQHGENRRTEIYVIGELASDGTAQISYDARPSQNKFIEAQVVDPQSLTANSNSNKANDSKRVVPASHRTHTTSKTSSSRPKKTVRKSHYAIGDVIEVATVNYEHGKANIDEKKSPGLVDLVDILGEHPNVIIEIASHTDASGSASYNAELSQKRANAIKKYLERRGVSAARLKAKGYGESRLLNKCKDGVRCSDEEHAQNRRTEFKVIAQKGFRVGDVIKVDNIFYETNKAKLDMKKSRGLQEIIQILQDNQISVEIRSHTDSNGSSSYNAELSEKRAKVVYDYLVSKGVNRHRLKYKGYGESMLLNKCKDGVRCSDEQHQVNRRTDFKVIGLR